MMEVSKVLLYCTKAKPHLLKCGKRYDLFTEKEMRKAWEEECDIASEGHYCIDDYKDYVWKYELNYSVCFECDCKEAFKLMYWWYNIEESDAGFYGDNKDGEMFCNRNFKRLGLGKDDISTNDKLFEYGKGEDLYAYHFDNIKPIDPMPITQLYRDGTMVYPLTRAPQSYCFAYRKVETTKEDYLANVGKDESRYYLQENGKFFYSEKVLVFSIRSPWLCKIANGNKDLEVRKTRVQNAGIECK